MKLLALKRVILPLSNHEFRLLWAGQAISAFGNPFQMIALAWFVLQHKGSPLDLASIMLALTVPQAALTLVGGIITDRFDARTVILWSDVTRTLTSGVIALLAFIGSFPLWLLCLLLIFHSAANGIFNPAARSIAPCLVSKEALDGANALMESISHLGTTLGAIPAGIIVANSSPAFAFALNSFSFAIAVLATFCMTQRSQKASHKKSSPWRDILQGFVYLWRLPWLIILLLVDTCAAIAAVGPIAIGLPFLVRNILHVGVEEYSVLLWSFGCGSILGMLLPVIFPLRLHRGLVFCFLQLLEAPLFAGIVIFPLPIVMCCLATLGLLNGFLVVLFLSLIQTNVAHDMIGRSMSFFMLASLGFIPLSQYASGLIITLAGIKPLFISAGVLTMFGAVMGLLVPSLRRLN